MLNNRGNDNNGYLPVLLQMQNSGGIENFTGDYSVTATEPEIAPSASVLYRIDALQILLAWNDGGAAAIDWSKWGNLNALGNGISIKAQINGFVHDFMSIQKFSANAQLWEPVFTEDHHHSMMLRGILPLTSPINIDGAAGDRFYLVLNDNFTGLTTQRFAVTGHYAVATV